MYTIVPLKKWTITKAVSSMPKKNKNPYGFIRLLACVFSKFHHFKMTIQNITVCIRAVDQDMREWY